MEVVREGLGWLVSDAALSTALDIVVRSTIVLVAAAVVCWLLRHSSAATRHLVWSLAVAALLVLPALTVFVPWELRVLPAVASAESRLTESQAPVSARTPFRPSGFRPSEMIAALADALSPAIQSHSRGQGTGVRARGPHEAVSASRTEVASAEASVDRRTSSAVKRAVASASAERGVAGTIGRFRPPFLLIAWTVGAAILLVRLMAGMLAVRLSAYHAEELKMAEWRQQVDRLTRRCGIHRPIRLLQSRLHPMPMTWGVLHPVVMMPATAEEWTAERRELVLLHELAHIRRLDVLMRAMAQAVCAVYWFNPLVWFATSRMRAECERACDDWVLRAGVRASTYADHLLDMVRTIGRSPLPAPVLSMARRRGFEGRLLAILEPGAKRNPVRRTVMAAGAAVTVPLTVAVAAAAPVGSVSADDVPITTPAIEFEGNARRLRALAPVDTPAVYPAVHGPVSAFDHEAVTDAINDALTEALEEGLSRTLADVAAAGWTDLPVVRAIGSTADPSRRQESAAAALASALADPDAGVRAAAAQALGDFQDPSTVAALAEALRGDSVAEVRRLAAWALGEIEDAAGVSALSAALQDDEDVEVRRMAVWALGEIEDDSAIDGLVAGLGDADVEIRRSSAWALGEIESPSAVEGLAAMLAEDEDAEARKQAAWALGEIEDETAVPVLAAALNDDDSEVRNTAIWALSEIEPSTAPPALIEALRHSDQSVRIAAAHALGQIEDPAAAPALTALLEDGVADVRRAALNALTSIGGVSAVDALVRLLQDPDPEIRQAAARALGRSR